MNAPAGGEDVIIRSNAKQVYAAIGHFTVTRACLLSVELLRNQACSGVENIKVAAIIDKYGITNVWDWGNGERIKSKSVARWLGTRKDDKKFAMSLSPINYVHKDNPPIFIVHGDADPTVPYEQSVDLHQRLKAAGVKTEFMTVAGRLHGKFSRQQNSEVNKAIVAFLVVGEFLVEGFQFISLGDTRGKLEALAAVQRVVVHRIQEVFVHVEIGIPEAGENRFRGGLRVGVELVPVVVFDIRHDCLHKEEELHDGRNKAGQE